MQLKLGGILHLKLNIGKRPIANKYREGKMKRTLKRELKVPEIAEREAFGSSARGGLQPGRPPRGALCPRASVG